MISMISPRTQSEEIMATFMKFVGLRSHVILWVFVWSRSIPE